MWAGLTYLQLKYLPKVKVKVTTNDKPLTECAVTDKEESVITTAAMLKDGGKGMSILT